MPSAICIGGQADGVLIEMDILPPVYAVPVYGNPASVVSSELPLSDLSDALRAEYYYLQPIAVEQEVYYFYVRSGTTLRQIMEHLRERYTYPRCAL